LTLSRLSQEIEAARNPALKPRFANLTAKLSGVDPQAWVTNVLDRIADHKITKLDELMPWHYAQT